MLRRLALITLLAACGGSSSDTREAKAPVAPADAAAPPAETDSERKLRAAQSSAVAAMCERLVDCSAEDAHATMSPDEAAQTTTPEILGKARAECEDEYGQLTLSPRQVKVIQHCVNGAIECSELAGCLADAGKK